MYKANIPACAFQSLLSDVAGGRVALTALSRGGSFRSAEPASLGQRPACVTRAVVRGLAR